MPLSLALRGQLQLDPLIPMLKENVRQEVAMQAKTILWEATDEIRDKTKKLQKQAPND